MSDEDIWLVAFGSGWVSRLEVMSATGSLFDLYRRLAQNNRFVFDPNDDRIKLERNNEPIRV